MQKFSNFFSFKKTIFRELFAQKCFDEYRGDELAPGRDCQSDKEV